MQMSYVLKEFVPLGLNLTWLRVFDSFVCQCSARLFFEKFSQSFLFIWVEIRGNFPNEFATLAEVFDCASFSDSTFRSVDAVLTILEF